MIDLTAIEKQSVSGAELYNCHCFFCNTHGKILKTVNEEVCKNECCTSPLAQYHFNYGAISSCQDLMCEVIITYLC